jgi:PAS domain S-box-containing protein
VKLRHEHEVILDAAKTQFQAILEESKQAIYLYLDDTHKLCNKKFASMLGYSSPDEWGGVQKPFTEAFVETQSQQTLVSAYQEAIESKTGSCVNITWKKKTGGQVKTQVILVPISVNGTLLAMHFISSP